MAQTCCPGGHQDIVIVTELNMAFGLGPMGAPTQ